MSYKLNEVGPYGPSEFNTTAGLLNYFHQELGVELRKIDSGMVVDVETIKDHARNVLFRYRWFEGIDHPCVSNSHRPYVDVSKLDPFRIILTRHYMPGLEFSGAFATPELYDLLHASLTNYMNDPYYMLHINAGAFFQGGSDDPEGKWFLFEFWKPKGVHAFVNHLKADYNRRVS